MLDIVYIRNNKDTVEKALLKKGCSVDFTDVLKNDELRRELLQEVEANKAKQNRLSQSVPQVKKEGGDIQSIFKEVKSLAKDNEEKLAKLAIIEKEIYDFLIVLPNIPDDDLLPGEKENNKVIHIYGEQPKFNFKPKDHVELATSLGLIDFDRAAKIAGRGSWIYTDLGARLEWALINFFISEHLKDGYHFIMPPLLLNEESGLTAGQFPKFKNDVFWVNNIEPTRFLIPTAETALVNLYRGEILKEEDLPLKFFAYTPCFRSEAGSYRSEERGTIRGYQFNKVEMVQYTTPEGSDKAFEELVGKATSLMNKMGLHYRVSKLAAGDCSHSMARTYDIEVYIPSINIYKEVSSASNARDYQARRGMIRYRDKATGKTKFVNTLNASGLATSRVFPAILEQFQQEDGSVLVPDVLVPFMGGIKALKPLKK